MTIKDLCLKSSASVREAMNLLEENRQGIVLIIDDDGRLLGTVTDGDIRRALLQNTQLEADSREIMALHPMVAQLDDSDERVKELMATHRIRHIPILDEDGRPVRVRALEEFALPGQSFAFAVVMAGGEGQRLRPLTEQLPKPMVTVGDAPILENIVRHLVGSGIRQIYIAVNYKAEVIESHFGNGEGFGAEISYLREAEPLGTAGPLSLLPEAPTGPFLVVNGDVLTTSDFSRLLDYHRRHNAVATIAANEFRVDIPYGVLKVVEHHLLEIQEKPSASFLCNAGIYVLNAEVLDIIPRDKPFNMTDLFSELLNRGLPVAAFPVFENLVSADNVADLEEARRQFSTWPLGTFTKSE